jgi:hypothetical protein
VSELVIGIATAFRGAARFTVLVALYALMVLAFWRLF